MSNASGCEGLHTIRMYDGKRINACYSGGAYIDLTFDSYGCNPTEVINVWDYEKGEATIPDRDQTAVMNEVKAWIAGNEVEGWDNWFADYLENA